MSCFPPFIQAAAAYALDDQDRLVAPMKDECARRRTIAMDALEGIDGLDVNRIEGTFYAFPRWPPGRLREARRDAAEGAARRGRPGHRVRPIREGLFRISFCQCEEGLLRGLEGLRAFLHRSSSGRSSLG
jgi:aspartate/methionine/tyrosine aminotransferase